VAKVLVRENFSEAASGFHNATEIHRWRIGMGVGIQASNSREEPQ
jgi:hypothetical protein